MPPIHKGGNNMFFINYFKNKRTKKIENIKIGVRHHLYHDKCELYVCNGEYVRVSMKDSSNEEIIFGTVIDMSSGWIQIDASKPNQRKILEISFKDIDNIYLIDDMDYFYIPEDNSLNHKEGSFVEYDYDGKSNSIYINDIVTINGVCGRVNHISDNYIEIDCSKVGKANTKLVNIWNIETMEKIEKV